MMLYIKNMVCIRCKMLVREELKKVGLSFGIVELGEVEIYSTVTEEQLERLRSALLSSGLELMDNKKAILIERVKNAIVEMVHHTDELPRVNLSDYLSRKIEYDYTYLSNLFSEVMGMTIMNYVIAHKIERVKQLLVYDEMSLTEIAFKLHYSSVAHLSNQFKKSTGLTTSHFKRLRSKRLTSLVDV